MLAIRSALPQEDRMAIEVFISYAHKDRKLRDEFDAHLSNLRNQEIISDWYDGDILPGTEWEEQIMNHLKTSHIILLLISKDFLASKFCYSVELKEAIARHNAHQARVIPIILRPTDWKELLSLNFKHCLRMLNPSSRGLTVMPLLKMSLLASDELSRT